MTWIVLGAVAALAVLYWLAQRKKKGGGSLAARLRRQLLRLTHDPAVVERLIAAERARDPDASEITLLRKAIRRLMRDRGR